MNLVNNLSPSTRKHAANASVSVVAASIVSVVGLIAQEWSAQSLRKEAREDAHLAREDAKAAAAELRAIH